MVGLKNTLRFGLVSLVLCTAAVPRTIAQELKDTQKLATIGLACNVDDDTLLSGMQTSINIAIANANIDRRARGQEVLPFFDFTQMPEEPTRNFLGTLRSRRVNTIGGEEVHIEICCTDRPAPNA